jgi:hypothetical protein
MLPIRIDERYEIREGHVLCMRNFLESVPELLLEADAGPVTSNDD